MINTKKLELVKRIIYIAVCVVLVLVGFVIGTTVSQKESKKDEPVKTTQKKKEDVKTLTSNNVSDFLIAYYTKKDVGENRERYEPLTTTYMFNELVDREKQPVNQAYKGYIVNQVFERADIYVDDVNSTAIALVTYKYTKRAHKKTDEGALLNQTEQEAIKITFLKQGKTFLVNKINYVSLTEPQEGGYNNYKLELDEPDIKTTSSSEESTEASTVTTEESTVATTETEETTNE